MYIYISIFQQRSLLLFVIPFVVRKIQFEVVCKRCAKTLINCQAAILHIPRTLFVSYVNISMCVCVFVCVCEGVCACRSF